MNDYQTTVVPVPKPPLRASKLIATPRHRTTAPTYEQGPPSALVITSREASRKAIETNINNGPPTGRNESDRWISSLFRFRPDKPRPSTASQTTPRKKPGNEVINDQLADPHQNELKSTPLSVSVLPISLCGADPTRFKARVHRYAPCEGEGKWISSPAMEVAITLINSKKDCGLNFQIIQVRPEVVCDPLLNDDVRCCRCVWPVSAVLGPLAEEILCLERKVSTNNRAAHSQSAVEEGVAGAVKSHRPLLEASWPTSATQIRIYSSSLSIRQTEMLAMRRYSLSNPASAVPTMTTRNRLMFEVAAYSNFIVYVKAFNLGLKGMVPRSPRQIMSALAKGDQKAMLHRVIRPTSAVASPRSVPSNTFSNVRNAKALPLWSFVREEMPLAYSEDVAVIDIKVGAPDDGGENNSIATHTQMLSARIDTPPLNFSVANISSDPILHMEKTRSRVALSDAFTHFTLTHSKGSLAMQILSYDLTDGRPIVVAVHTNTSIDERKGEIPFGPALNGQRKSIIELIRAHTCNDLCKGLGLPPMIIH